MHIEKRTSSNYSGFLNQLSIQLCIAQCGIARGRNAWMFLKSRLVLWLLYLCEIQIEVHDCVLNFPSRNFTGGGSLYARPQYL